MRYMGHRPENMVTQERKTGTKWKIKDGTERKEERNKHVIRR